MANLYSKNFNDADEVKNPPKAQVQVVKLGNVNASKLVLEPGWRWSECITDSWWRQLSSRSRRSSDFGTISLHS